MADSATASSSVFNMVALPMADDRAASWRFFRDAGDVFESQGIWYITEPEAVRFALRSPELFSSAGAFTQHGVDLPQIPINIDPPDHKRYRMILDPLLSPRVVNAMEDTLRAQIGELVDAFVETGSCDVVADIGRLYPPQVFLSLFGLPLEDRDQLVHWVEEMSAVSHSKDGGPAQSVQDAANSLIAYLEGAIAAKREHPGDDMLTEVIERAADGQFSDDEILGLAFLFCRAGLHTVTSAIGFLMLHLAQHPEIRRDMEKDPSLVTRVIEESLRTEQPVPFSPRIAMNDVEVCGVQIPAGARVRICLATANRDADKYANPDELDLTAGSPGHLSFGGGIHRCLGSHLARRELKLVVEEFHRRIPDYELKQGAIPQVEWPSGTLHLSELNLVFAAGGRS
ncbi:cytochrome P450 [Rhodococcus wratislaviensis]|uniref:cytochrome P450 n=1 Tax=Rhodococcus wratislaviensis TaxID=44752 RepID=UPI0036475189